MILILSGGIGSGKSVAAGMLNEMYGFPIYCADKRVKELYDEHPTLLKDIEKELGCNLRDENGGFMPAVLARRIFSEGEVLEKVEALVFPVLKEDFLQWADKHPAAVHILESATILEKEYFHGFGDFALIITAPFDVRLARAMERDSADEKQIIARIQKQIMMNNPAMLEQFLTLPFEVCENAGTIGELRSKLAVFVEKYGLTKMLQGETLLFYDKSINNLKTL